jgi:hypothetical protein
VVEVAADSLALLHEHVAAEQNRGDQLLADRAPGVDLVLDQLAQHERALRMSDEDDAAALVVSA